MKSAVYARSFTDVGPGQVKLTRVAHFPVAPGLDEDMRAQHNTLLLHTEQSWALQGGSAAIDPSAMIDDCLLHREVVALPSSSALVFPLVDCSVLVGLLVVELEPEPGAAGGELVTAAEAGAGGGAAPALPGAASSVAALLPALCAGEGPAELGPEAEPRSLGVGNGGDDGRGPSSRMGRGQALGRMRRSLTDEELRCLRLAVPLLSKACGMDARASLQLAQSSVAAAAARGLLREAQRPLSALNTFSTMLVPRLKDGEPDKDLAKGVLLQGKRLQDLLWQLEDALHGTAAPGSGIPGAPASPPHAMPLPLSPDGRSGGAGLAAAAGTALPFRSPSGLPRDPSPAVQELLQLPPPRPVALPPSSQPQPAYALAESGAGAGPAASVAGDSGADALSPAEDSGASGAGPAPVLPGRVTFVDRTSDDASGSVSSSVGPFTIRQPPGFVAGKLRPGGKAHGTAPPPGAAMATIDVEMESCDVRPPSGLALDAQPPAGGGAVPATTTGRVGAGSAGSAGGSMLGWGQAQLHSAGGALAAAISTNLVSALAGVLIAAYKLAAVSGIGFIVNSPLSSVLPRRASSASGGGSAAANGSKARPGASAAASHGAVGNAGLLKGPSGLRLIPRPSRPLLVGVRAALAQKLVGYMLDIALQCTPRGGQVCVSARQDGAGVQVQVLHSGRMDLQRLHARSRAMLPSVLAAGAAAAVAAGRHSAAVAAAAAAAPAAAMGGGGVQPGSGVLSVEMAQELAQQAGGHLTVSYPFNMVNAQSGVLDVGTSVEIWLPGPGAV